MSTTFFPRPRLIHHAQTLTLDVQATVADLLGVTPQLRALRAIEGGDVATEHFDAIGDDWDVLARSDEALGHIGLGQADLHRRVSEVSGGEAMLIAIAGLRLRRASVTLLDEPTNNLDRGARARLGEMVRSWPGTLVVVSHDTQLLELMPRYRRTARRQPERLRGAVQPVAGPARPRTGRSRAGRTHRTAGGENRETAADRGRHQTRPAFAHRQDQLREQTRVKKSS